MKFTDAFHAAFMGAVYGLALWGAFNDMPALSVMFAITVASINVAFATAELSYERKD